MASYLAGSFGAVPKVSEGQIGRRLLRTDELVRMEAEMSDGEAKGEGTDRAPSPLPPKPPQPS